MRHISIFKYHFNSELLDPVPCGRTEPGRGKASIGTRRAVLYATKIVPLIVVDKPWPNG